MGTNIRLQIFVTLLIPQQRDKKPRACVDVINLERCDVMTFNFYSPYFLRRAKYLIHPTTPTLLF